jgi:hypothetical protein
MSNLIEACELDRATEFRQRCNRLEIQGVTLHSCRWRKDFRAVRLSFSFNYDSPSSFSREASLDCPISSRTVSKPDFTR